MIALAGVIAGAGAVWLAAHQPINRPTEPDPLLTAVVGASLLGCGLASWRARPENRLGPVMVITGFAWFAGQLSEASTPWVYTLGSAVQYTFVAGLVYLLLSFPSGRLRGRLDRWLMIGVGVLFAMELAAMLYGNRAGIRCPSCPNNLLQVFHDNRKAQAWENLERLLGGVLIAIVIGRLVWRWLRASPASRHAVAPVLVAGCASLAALVWTVIFDLLGDPLSSLPATVWFYTTAMVPIAVLYVFVQRRLARGRSRGSWSSWASPSTSVDLGEALARTLGDPSLELAFWFPAEECYVDGDGVPVKLPDEDSGRRATFVERDGQPIAALLHDPVLEHNAELVRSVCAAASLALENERLQAELRARLVELQASRARLVEATDAERRRIERDLHDGTQQRLVSIAMSLGLLESKLPTEAVAQPLVRDDASGAGAGAGRAARADPRNQSTAADRARAGGGARRAVPPGVAADAPPGVARTASAGSGRDRRLFRRQRGAHERGQALARDRGPRDRLRRRPAADRRGGRRRDRRRHHDRRLGPARPRRSRRGARRPLHGLQPARARHDAAS